MLTPADRGPGQLWRPGTPPPAPLPGIYDPAGSGRMLFAFFAAMGETERENIREATLEGLDAAARKGKYGGRPAVITEDMLHTVLHRRANGETVEQIRPDLFIATGKRKGRNPSVASIYRALAAHEKTQAYPAAVEQARIQHGQRTGADLPAIVRPRPARVLDPIDAELAPKNNAWPCWPHLDIEGVPDPGARPLDRPDPSGLANDPVSAASPIRNPPPRRQFC
ncbi:recombinase family protein [Micromonospora sp. NPDC005413]|uniref:recombinase family protein n=1 Tax=Micromonospora sp. NPDC005413 TaxID=3154563 RepID=UPI0033B7FD49